MDKVLRAASLNKHAGSFTEYNFKEVWAPAFSFCIHRINSSNIKPCHSLKLLIHLCYTPKVWCFLSYINALHPLYPACSTLPELIHTTSRDNYPLFNWIQNKGIKAEYLSTETVRAGLCWSHPVNHSYASLGVRQCSVLVQAHVFEVLLSTRMGEQTWRTQKYIYFFNNISWDRG